MDDDNRLDLSLSLPCGGPSATLKGKAAVESEEADSRGSKIIDDFKNFLDGSNHKDESTQRTKQSKPEEKIYYDLSKGPSNSNMEVGNKRKNMFDEVNNKKYLATMQIKPRTPHVTDDGSTAENEDVADSEADDVSKRSMEVRVSESASVDLQSQRAFTISSKNVMSLPYSLSMKESTTIPGSQQPVIPANLPLMYGYAPVQVATVSAVITAATPVNAPKPFDRVKGDGKKAKEDGPSVHTEVDMKGTNVIDLSKPDGYPEYPSIRPGIAAELKFGGSGSSPNLPWVSTTGPGPNGKTISGVTYKYTGTQIRIVCACHGTHMSPEEFVQHATEEQPNINGGPVRLPSFSNSNPAASAQN